MSKKENLRAALQELEKNKGVSVRSVAQKFGVPPTTLQRHVNTDSQIGAGRPTVLTHAEEREIVYSCQVLQEMGFGMTRDMVGSIVVDYLSTVGRDNPFNGQPGYKWWKGFLQRFPQLVDRKPQHLPKHRAIAGTEATVQGFLAKVSDLLQSLNLTHLHDLNERLWNCDESGVCTSVASTTVLARRGAKWVHETTGGSGREVTTIHLAGSASGRRLPPFVVYKGKHLYSTWTNGGPAGARYSVSESGWMEKENFLSWFEKLFLPSVKAQLDSGPVVLIFDGHHSHISIKLLELARANNVHLVCLPAHTSHILQPLDVGVFGPMKATWKRVLKEYKTSTRAANVTKEVFPSLLKQLLESSFCPEHIRAGFRGSGLYPLKPSAIAAYKLAPSVAIVGSSSKVTKETPLRTELRHFFAKRLQPTEEAPKAKRKRLQLHIEGEALTNEEVIGMLRKQEEEKKASKKSKTHDKRKRKKAPATTSTQTAQSPDISEQDTTHCFKCGGVYHEADAGDWVGCDKCYRWFHFRCAGFQRLPKETEQFVCHICKN